MIDTPSKPPFSYYGGKQRLAKRIVNLLPPHTVYVEPYCGSAAVFFKKGLPDVTNNDNYREVLNDNNGLIINFFRVMQDTDSRQQLIDRLQWTIYSQDDFKLAQFLCKNKTDDKIEMAWAWFVNINWSFSNDLNRGMKHSVISKNIAASHENAVKRLLLYKERMSRVILLNEPALKAIKRYDSPQTVFFIDPPYPGSNQGHYSGFTQIDFDNLIKKIESCLGSVILTCYENNSVPKHWEKHSFDVIASSSGITHKNREVQSTREKDMRKEFVWIKKSRYPMREKLNPIANENVISIKRKLGLLHV